MTVEGVRHLFGPKHPCHGVDVLLRVNVVAFPPEFVMRQNPYGEIQVSSRCPAEAFVSPAGDSYAGAISDAFGDADFEPRRAPYEAAAAAFLAGRGHNFPPTVAIAAGSLKKEIALALADHASSMALGARLELGGRPGAASLAE